MTDVTAEDSVKGDEQQPALDPVDEHLIDRLPAGPALAGCSWPAKAGCWRRAAGVRT